MQDQICYIWAFLGWNSQNLLHCDILRQHPEIFPNTTFRPNMKILKFENKIVLIWYIGYFRLEFQKTDVVFEIKNLLIYNVSSKNKKSLKLGPKIPHVGILGCNLIKTIIRFLISTLEFVKLQNFIQNKQKNKITTKNALLGFWTGMFKNCCHICDQRPPICLNVKFCVKIRIVKFGTKNGLFGYFWFRTLKIYCRI